MLEFFPQNSAAGRTRDNARVVRELADSRKLDKQRLLLKKEIRLLTNLRV